MRWWIAIVALAGCGRIHFDEGGPGGSGTTAPDDAGGGDAVAEVCADGDDLCSAICVGLDADCVNVCGDSRCVGNAGELCGDCMADCAIAAGCGNGACEPGEDGASCYADCGPIPWMWTGDETALEAEINSTRVNGVTCPGDAVPRFAPALSPGSSQVRAGAREHAWEIAHHRWPVDGTACNGRTFSERQAHFGGSSGLTRALGGPETAAEVVVSWASNSGLCPVLMATTRTRFATGVAISARYAWVLWFE